jgi:CelD/BcsL family acetyltransferase involved in cellulose biosynthesis
MRETEFIQSVSVKPVTEVNKQLSSTGKSTRLEGAIAYTLTSPETLSSIWNEWSDLANHASESNTFYEPVFFKAATGHLKQEGQWRIIVVQDSESHELLGFFPFLLQKGPCGLHRLSLWKSEMNYLTTPLIRDGCERSVWRIVMEHVKCMSPRIDLVEFPMNVASGRVHQELHSLIRDDLLTTYQYDHFSRAELRIGHNYDQYLKQVIGGHHLRGYRRMRRRLDGFGQIEFRLTTDLGHSNCWTNWFLELEARSWKGDEETAMQQSSEEERFFRELVSQGLKQECLEMVGLFLDGEPIAMAVTLVSSQGKFAYKIAFDENYKKYSPGVLLQLHLTQKFLEEKKDQWIDSCAVPSHPMINRLWSERRSIQHLVVSTGRPLANFVLGSMPLLRTIKRTVQKAKPKKKLTSPSATKE